MSRIVSNFTNVTDQDTNNTIPITDESVQAMLSALSNQSNEKPILDPLNVPSYRVEVKFMGLFIYPPHEDNNDATDSAQEGSEFRFDAYVQGNRINLVDPSKHYLKSGSIFVSFGSNGVPITVNLPNTQPLSIMTVGYEKDGCGNVQFPDNVQQQVVRALSGPNVRSELKTIQKDITDKINSLCKPGQDRDDLMGNINIVYGPTGYGKPHDIQGPPGPGYPSYEYQLIYTIKVNPAARPLATDIQK